MGVFSYTRKLMCFYVDNRIHPNKSPGWLIQEWSYLICCYPPKCGYILSRLITVHSTIKLLITLMLIYILIDKVITIQIQVSVYKYLICSIEPICYFIYVWLRQLNSGRFIAMAMHRYICLAIRTAIHILEWRYDAIQCTHHKFQIIPNKNA